MVIEHTAVTVLLVIGPVEDCLFWLKTVSILLHVTISNRNSRYHVSLSFSLFLVYFPPALTSGNLTDIPVNLAPLHFIVIDSLNAKKIFSWDWFLWAGKKIVLNAGVPQPDVWNLINTGPYFL